MKIHILTLRYSGTLGAFDPTPLEEFSRTREILGLNEHFFTVENVPYLLCVLRWHDHAIARGGTPARDRPTSAAGSARADPNDKKPDPRDELDEHQRMLYDAIRDWRADRAREEGVQRFIILTNKEVAQIVKRRPENATALSQIEGVGRKRIERHGADILRILAAAPNPLDAIGVPTPDDDTPARDDAPAEATP